MVTLSTVDLLPADAPANALPRVGCNATIDDLPPLLDWLLDGQRDLEISDPGRWQNLDAGAWNERANVMRRHLAGYTGRIGVHAPHRGLPIDSPDPEIRAVVSSRLLQAMQYAAELGATHMVVHSPFVARGNGFISDADLATSIDWIHATLDPVIRLAETADCTVVIENIQDVHPHAQLATVRSFDTRHVRLSIDVGHAQLQVHRGGTPPNQWILATAPYLHHLHLQDNDGMSDRHWAPGDGVVNWYGVFESLATLEHEPRLIVETKHRHRGYRYLTERGLAR